MKLTATGVAMIVRCIDNLFQTDVLVVGREYEVRAERDDCYILSKRNFTTMDRKKI